MSEFVEILSSYVPQFVRKKIANTPDFMAQQSVEKYEAAVLFTDISGFTALAETLALEGPSGMEKLTSYLNEYFARLIENIHEHGGDIMKFAGDAMLVIWLANERAESLTQATQAVTQCGLDLQNLSSGDQTIEDISLSLRSSIGTGTIWISQLGGINDYWEFLIAGDPINQVASADKWGTSSHVTLSPEAWQLVKSFSIGTPVAEGNVQLSAIHEKIPLKPIISSKLPVRAETALKHYIPLAIASRVSAGQTAWLAELRRITVLFINLPGQRVATDKNLSKNQQVMETFQTIIHQLEGTINKLSVDDKGVSILAAWGLPPLTHEDDSMRGVQAAMDIVKALKNLGEDCAIGIATGTAFCGSVGSPARREYTMIGNVVNLSARLMQGALEYQQSSEKIPILCDQFTHQGAVSHQRFAELSPIQCKGIAEPVRVYCPLGITQSVIQTQTHLVGRIQEQQQINDSIHHLVKEHQSRTILIEGEPGIGKSRLVKHASQLIEESGGRYFLGEANSIETSTPYLAWRSIFHQLLGLKPDAQGGEAIQKDILAALTPFSEYASLAALLNPILPVEFPESEESQKFADRARLLKTQEILTTLLSQLAKKTPLAVIIEDAHWLDTTSWSLLERVWTEVSPLLLIVASRPFSAEIPPEYKRLREAQQTLHLNLAAMELDETIALICQRLGVPSLPQAVANFIGEKAQGNPFFSEEIAYTLRDTGQLRIEDNHCSLTILEEELQTLNFPHTVQGVITSRIDRLSPQQQFSLKVASVIGRVFAFPIFKDIYPIESDKIQLEEIVDALERLDIIPREVPQAYISYLFKHIITQEVVYQLMLYAQRRKLHRATAEWYEQTYGSELSNHYPVLAHHWSHAADNQSGDFTATTKAIHYLEQSGNMAMNSGAFPEAVQLLQKAWDLYGSLPESEKNIEQGLQLLQSLGTATFTTTGYGETSALAVFDQAWELSQSLGEGAQIFPILWGLWINYHFSSRTEEAIELGEKLLSLAQKENNPEFLLQAHHALWTTLMLVPDYERSQQHLEAGWKLYHSEMHQDHCRLYGGHDPGMCCQRAQCLSKWCLGYPDQAIEAGLASIELSQSHYYSRMTAHMAVAFIYKQRGDIEPAQEHANAIVQLANKHGFPGFVLWAEIILGWCQGQREWQKSSSVETGIATILNASNQLGYKDPGYMAMLAELYLLANHLDEGLALLAELFDVVEAKNEHNYEPELFRLHGEFFWKRALLKTKDIKPSLPSADYQAIESCFLQSLEIAKSQGAKSLELRSALSLGRLYQAQGKAQEGKTQLQTIYNAFTEGFETNDLQMAQELLDSMV